MKRGELWTAAGGSAYTGKPRPVLLVQSDLFDALDSIVVCALTTDPTELPLFRVPLQPTPENGLRQRCNVMIDKISSIPKARLGHYLGVIEPRQMTDVSAALAVFLALARSNR